MTPAQFARQLRARFDKQFGKLRLPVSGYFCWISRAEQTMARRFSCELHA
jgi:hypothetical protein